MKPLRTYLTLKALNHFQKQLSKKELRSARLYFDRISSVRFKTRLKNVVDKSILNNGRELRVRIYEPLQNTAATIVFFHGGGWVFGSLESHDEVARLLCKNTHATVVAVDYRLAPEHTYPAQSEDGIVVIRHLEELNIPSTSLFLAGDSAGGQIALDVALRLPRIDRRNLKGIILAYPSLDPNLTSESMQRFATKHFVTKDNMKYFWQSYVDGQKYEWPLNESELEKLPPVFIQVAGHDILRDEGLAFADQLKRHGNVVQSSESAFSTHGMLQIQSILSGRSKALKSVRDFVKKFQ